MLRIRLTGGIFCDGRLWRMRVWMRGKDESGRQQERHETRIGCGIGYCLLTANS